MIGLLYDGMRRYVSVCKRQKYAKIFIVRFKTYNKSAHKIDSDAKIGGVDDFEIRLLTDD